MEFEKLGVKLFKKVKEKHLLVVLSREFSVCVIGFAEAMEEISKFLREPESGKGILEIFS